MSLEKHVIIIGAGASGLLAADELSQDCATTILESRNSCGGRIRSIPLADQAGIVEAGAEFIHGDLPITGRLLREANLTRVPLEGKMYRKENGAWEKQEEMIEGWDDMLKRMKNEPPSVTMDQFLDKHFPKDRYAGLRKHVRGYVQGFDVANMNEVTVCSLYEEWSNEGEQYHLKEGYSALVSHLVNRIKGRGVAFNMDDAVQRVKWSRNKVEVTCASGTSYHGTHLLITVPIPILRDHALIEFLPAIHQHREAATQIGFGSVVKVVLDFREKIWQKDMGFVFSDERIPTWWTQFPENNNLLTGWAGGPDAVRIYHLSGEALLQVALESLSGIFDRSTAELGTILRSSNVFNWIREKECPGAYSFATTKTGDARAVLQQPVDETLFFAGEGLYQGPYPGTVEAAFATGMRAAQQIRKTIR